jgi:SAM-dependent methyltransferase
MRRLVMPNVFNNIDKTWDYALNSKRKRMIIDELSPYLNQVFGYHALLYTPQAKLLTSNNLSIKNQFVIEQKAAEITQSDKNDLSFFCSFDELPIASDCIDLAFLPNILQNASNPHQVLREVERVLIPEGVVILIGRNPFSWQGISATFARWRLKQTPIMPDISKSRIADWFRLLGFETEKQINISVSNHNLQNKNLYPWVKKIAQTFCGCFCSYYIIIATKKVSTLTPIRASWKSNKQLVPARLAEPSVRTQVEKLFVQVNKLPHSNSSLNRGGEPEPSPCEGG